MKKLVFIFVAAAVLGVNAQDAKPDYVVTIKNDTLYGVVDILTFDFIDRVQFIGQKERKAFTAVQVRAVTIKQETYHPVKTVDGYVMMKLQTPGFLSLYLAHQPKGNSYEVSYLVKKSGDNLEVPNIAFKKYMSDFLSECPGLKEQIKSGELGKRELDKIVEDFNLCAASLGKPQQVAAADPSDPRIVALTDLKAKLEKDTILTSKKDALDILNDITEKVRTKQAVPNYQLEGLKEQLKDTEAYQSDMEKISDLLKSQ